MARSRRPIRREKRIASIRSDLHPSPHFSIVDLLCSRGRTSARHAPTTHQKKEPLPLATAPCRPDVVPKAPYFHFRTLSMSESTTPWVVCKFGGTSVSSRDRWTTIAEVVRTHRNNGHHP